MCRALRDLAYCFPRSQCQSASDLSIRSTLFRHLALDVERWALGVGRWALGVGRFPLAIARLRHRVRIASDYRTNPDRRRSRINGGFPIYP